MTSSISGAKTCSSEHLGLLGSQISTCILVLEYELAGCGPSLCFQCWAVPELDLFFPALRFISLWNPLTKSRALTSSWIKLSSLIKRSSNELHCRELGKLTLLLLWHRLWSRLEQEVGVLELHDTGGVTFTPGLAIKHIHKAGKCWRRAGGAEAPQEGGKGQLTPRPWRLLARSSP